MLIRRELDTMMGTIQKKIDDLERIVTDTRRLTDLETRVDDIEKYSTEGI